MEQSILSLAPRSLNNWGNFLSYFSDVKKGHISTFNLAQVENQGCELKAWYTLVHSSQSWVS